MNLQLAKLKIRLETHGLLALGLLELDGDTWVLVGNAGSQLWPVFAASPEYADGLPDPMDRWCRSIGNGLAAELGSRVIFPFEGPPYPPFLDWAAQAGVAFQSPLSMFVHPRFGLWHAFRFALALNQPPVENSGEVPPSPCLTCQDQPCLQACPVNAFGDGDYRVDDCLDYLNLNMNSDCRTSGCAARRACPVGREFVYQGAHAQFHMQAFIAAHTRCSTENNGRPQ